MDVVNGDLTSLELLAVFGNAIAMLMLWILVSAGYSKLLPANRDYYLSVFAGYGIGKTPLAGMLLYGVAMTEIVTGLLVIALPLRTPGLVFAAIILLGYLLLMAKQLWQGKVDMECGCSGPGSGIKLTPVLLIRNAVLIGLLPLAAISVSGLSTSFWIMSIATALTLILASLSFDQLLQNSQKIKALKAI